MKQNNKNLYALIRKDRAVALLDRTLGSLTAVEGFDVVAVTNTGSTTVCTSMGVISALKIYTIDDKVYYIVTDWPDDVSIDEANEIIN